MGKDKPNTSSLPLRALGRSAGPAPVHEPLSTALWGFFARLAACESSGQTIVGTYYAQHDAALKELLATKWAKRELLAKFEIEIESHLTDRRLRTYSCRPKPKKN